MRSLEVKDFVGSEDVLLPAVLIAVHVPDLPGSAEVSCIVDDDLHAVRRHDPQIQHLVFAAVSLPAELRSDVHVGVPEVIPVHLDRIPEGCRRHERIRPVFQQLRHVIQFRFVDAARCLLVVFPRKFRDGFRHHLQTREVCDFRQCAVPVLLLDSQPFKEGFFRHVRRFDRLVQECLLEPVPDLLPPFQSSSPPFRFSCSA